MRRKLAAGNWKMNGTTESMSELRTLCDNHRQSGIEIVICPPATLISTATEVTRNAVVGIGAQDCHALLSGAHTGDVSALMLADAGATWVITGHSERRKDHTEGDELVHDKARAVQQAGLTAIVCVGESAAQRKAGETLDIIADQLGGSVPDESTADDLVVAYEPIWAIGTGLIPTLEQIGEVHDFIRNSLTLRFGQKMADGVRILYGGSVNATNAQSIFSIANVDGALVGGASLKAADFSPIVAALENSAA